MSEQAILKSFLEVVKTAQEERDGEKIAELEELIHSLQHSHLRLQQDYSQMKLHHQEQLQQLRIQNVCLDSANKAAQLRCTMLEKLVEEAQQKDNCPLDPRGLTAFRVLQQQNQQLRVLLKKNIAPDCT